MKTMSSPAKESSTKEYENDSHLMRKKKAEENRFNKKNFREIADLIDDEDGEIAEKYARHIR